MTNVEDVDGDCNESQPCGDEEFDTWDWYFDWDVEVIETDCEPDFVSYPKDLPF